MDTLPANPLPRSVRWFAPWTWKHGRWLIAAIAVLMLPSYPLSIGPVMWLDRQGMMPAVVGESLNVVYLPLGLAMEQSEWCASAMESYAHWWIDPPPEIRDYPANNVP
jgi:hypothetical protein